MSLLSAREARALHFITKFEEARGGAPTYSEMMAALNIKSKGHVSYILRSLRDKGCIDINFSRKRGIVIEKQQQASHGSSEAHHASILPEKPGEVERGAHGSLPARSHTSSEREIIRGGDAMFDRFVDSEPTYAELVERNRQYLLSVVKHHPELAHMVPEEMLLAPAPKPDPEPVKPVVVYADMGTPNLYSGMHSKAAEIAQLHGVTVEELIGRNKSPRYTPARSDFVVACRKMGKTFQQIGIYMSGRDWATIIHYERKARLQEAA